MARAKFSRSFQFLFCLVEAGQWSEKTVMENITNFALIFLSHVATQFQVINLL